MHKGPLRSSQTKLLLIAPSHQLAQKGTALGFRIWSLCDPLRLETDLAARIEEASEKLLFANFSDETSLREAIFKIVRRHHIDAVLHGGPGSPEVSVMRESWQSDLSVNPPAVYQHLEFLERGVHKTASAPRVSVETLTVDGEHQILGFTAQRTTGPPHFHATGYLHPAPLTDYECRTIEAIVEERLIASEYRSGPAHTQVALLPQGPRIVSCRAHLGADRIPLLFEIARGFDLESALFMGLRGCRPAVPGAYQYAEIGFFLLPEGRLETFTGMEDIAVTPWVRGARFSYIVGDLVAPIGDPRARCAYVIVEGDTPEITRERIAKARSDLVADIRQGS